MFSHWNTHSRKESTPKSCPLAYTCTFSHILTQRHIHANYSLLIHASTAKLKKHRPESGSQQWSLTSPLYRPLLLISRAGLTNSRHRGKARGPMRLDRSTAPIPGSYPLLEYSNHSVRNSDSLQRSSGWGTEDRREQTETCQQPCPWVRKQVLPTVVRRSRSSKTSHSHILSFRIFGVYIRTGVVCCFKS